jgi:integrase
MSKLKALQIKSRKDPGRLSDGQGLFFEITETGVKRWIYCYKIQGKSGKYTVGRYPDLSLQDARREHQEARKHVQQGFNPAKERKKKKQAVVAESQLAKRRRVNSFKNIACEWVDQQKGGWSNSHAEAVISTLEINVFPHIGEESVETVSPPDILIILRLIEKRGSLEIARKVLQRTTAVFRYAIQTGRATYNPAADMKGVLKSRPVQHMPSVRDKDLSKLLKDITANQKLHITTKLCLHFVALCGCRPGEARLAQWFEVDLEAKEWTIPAERMKMRRTHVVPLSEQAIAVLVRAERIFGTETFLFPSVRDLKKPMSDNAMSKALRDMGYKGKATPHGFRASFSTMAYESGKFNSEVIEKALAHEEKNKIKGAYNRAEYLIQRRELLQWWGNKLQSLEFGAEVTQFSANFGKAVM